MSNIETNRQQACAYLGLIAKGDAEAVANMFAEDGRIVLPSRTLLPSEVKGREAIKAMIASVSDFFPETGLRLFVDETTAEGNRVAIVAHSDAVHASGKPYRNNYHFLIYFADGKISESREYMDTLHLTDVFFDGARPQS